MADSRSQHLDADEAGSVLRLTATTEWQIFEAYIRRRLAACENDLGTLSIDTARGLIAQAQGRRIEISAILSLRDNAEKVLESSRTRK